MTENYPPRLPVDDFELPPVASSTAPLPAPEPAAGGDGGSSTGDVAKDQAANVAHGAAQAGQQVATVVKDQASQVGAEAGRQVKDLFDQVQGQLTEQTGVQQQRLVGGLQALRDELRSMAQNADQPGVGSDLVGQAAERTGAVAGWLDGRQPAELIEEVTSFARRRPGAFLAIAGGIGLLAGRLARGLKAQSDTAAPSVTEPQSTLASSSTSGPYPVPADGVPSTPVQAVGLGDEPLAVPIVPDFPTPGYLGDAS